MLLTSSLKACDIQAGSLFTELIKSELLYIKMAGAFLRGSSNENRVAKKCLTNLPLTLFYLLCCLDIATLDISGGTRLGRERERQHVPLQTTYSWINNFARDQTYLKYKSDLCLFSVGVLSEKCSQQWPMGRRTDGLNMRLFCLIVDVAFLSFFYQRGSSVAHLAKGDSD